MGIASAKTQPGECLENSGGCSTKPQKNTGLETTNVKDMQTKCCPVESSHPCFSCLSHYILEYDLYSDINAHNWETLLKGMRHYEAQ